MLRDAAILTSIQIAVQEAADRLGRDAGPLPWLGT
jgi:hypothetical protein